MPWWCGREPLAPSESPSACDPLESDDNGRRPRTQPLQHGSCGSSATWHMQRFNSGVRDPHCAVSHAPTRFVDADSSRCRRHCGGGRLPRSGVDRASSALAQMRSRSSPRSVSRSVSRWHSRQVAAGLPRARAPMRCEPVACVLRTACSSEAPMPQ
jgi:hypothetical protein